MRGAVVKEWLNLQDREQISTDSWEIRQPSFCKHLFPTLQLLVKRHNNGERTRTPAPAQKNKAAGKAGEKQVKDDLKNELKDGEALLEQPSFKTEKGNRAKPDYAIIDKEGNVVKTIDSKTGKAKLSPNQKDLQQNGGTLVGKKYKEHNGAVAKPNTLEERRPF